VKASLLKLQPHLANLLLLVLSIAIQHKHFHPSRINSLNLSLISQKNCEYLIGGDFNCNLLKYHEQSNVTNFVDSLASCGCISLINNPIRFSKNCTPSLLDPRVTQKDAYPYFVR